MPAWIVVAIVTVIVVVGVTIIMLTRMSPVDIALACVDLLCVCLCLGVMMGAPQRRSAAHSVDAGSIDSFQREAR